MLRPKLRIVGVPVVMTTMSILVWFAAAYPASAVDLPPPPDEVQGHVGTVKYTILEQFGVTATETLQSMYWVHQGSSVWFGGYTEPQRCYTSAFPGWSIERCELVFVDNTPTSVYQDMWGEFENSSFRIAYTQRSHQTTTGTLWGYQCWLEDGALPVGWSEDCQGATSQAF